VCLPIHRCQGDACADSNITDGRPRISDRHCKNGHPNRHRIVIENNHPVHSRTAVTRTKCVAAVERFQDAEGGRSGAAPSAKSDEGGYCSLLNPNRLSRSHLLDGVSGRSSCGSANLQ